MYSKSKKVLVVTLIAALILSLLVGCGKGKYPDVKEYVDAVIICMENHSEQVLKAQTGEEIAAEIIKYGDELFVLSKRGNALYKKYPEFNYDDEHMPKKLKKQHQRLIKARNDSYIKISPHIEQFMDDPVVLEANTRLYEKFDNDEDFEE